MKGERRTVSVLLFGLAFLGLAPLEAGAFQEGEGALTGPVLHGMVRADGLRPDGVLPGALVQVRQGDRVRTVVSDARGRYRMERLEPGPAQVTVFHLSARDLRVVVRLPRAGEVSLDLELERRVLTLSPLEVRGHPSMGLFEAGRARVAAASAGHVHMAALSGTTGMTEAGLIGVLGALPSEEEPSPDRVLFMRGSTVDSRTVLLDGTPILTPFHVAGLLPPFQADHLDEALHFLGGAPSRYADGLSSVLDVATRTPRADRPHGSVLADGLVAGGSVEAPLPGGGGVLFGGRHLHGLQGELLGDGGFPYAYGDLLLRWHLPLAPGHRLDYTGYLNREGVRLDDVLLEGGRARWGNRMSSARYSGRVGDVGVSAVLAGSRYDSSLPLEWEEPVLAGGEARHLRSGVRLFVPGDGWTLEGGASVDRAEYRYTLDPRSPIRTTRVPTLPADLRSTSMSVFGEIQAPVGDRFHLRGGLRGQLFDGGKGLRLAPRGAARFLLGEAAHLTLSAGRYHQAVAMPGLVAIREEEGPSALEWNPSLPVASANHLVLTLDQTLDERVRIEVSGFIKTFEGLTDAPSPEEFYAPFQEALDWWGVEPGDLPSPPAARISSSGTDLRVGVDGERVGGWIGYALSWFWEDGYGSPSTTFTGRHLVSSGLRARLFEGMELDLTVGYGAGLPLSAVTLSAPHTTMDAGRAGGIWQMGTPMLERLSTAGGEGPPLELVEHDDFLRVDLQLAWEAEPRVGSRSTRLRPYVRVLNALNRRDALFQYFDRWREGGVRPVADRPFIPVVGVEWRF
jgi:hypothetical protein